MNNIDRDDGALISALDSMRDAAKKCIEQYANQERLGLWLPKPSPDFHELELPIIAALQAHSEFKEGTRRSFKGKHLMLQPQYQASNALRVAAEQDSAAAVGWLRKVFSTTKTSIRYVAEVYGIKVIAPIILGNGVSLLPLDQLPPSKNAKAVQAQFQIAPGPRFIRMEQAIGATFQEYDVKEKFLEGTHLNSETLETTIRAFTLAGDAAPVIGVSWIDFVDADLEKAELGRGWASPRFEGTLPVFPYEVDTAALEWVDRYLALDSRMRGVCDVAIERLNLGRRRYSSGNQAIEAGICLEALLGDPDGQELTYKLRLRAALLLESEIEPRREIMKAVKDLYDLRSKTVHGRMPKQETAKHQKDAKRGLNICARALQSIVRLGRPFVAEDWELSGGLQS